MNTIKKIWILFFLLLIIICLQKVVSAPNPDISGKYLMDGLAHRVIVITHISDVLYRIEEPSGSWPWDGCGIFDGDMIFSIAKFKDSRTSMMLRGRFRRSDGSIDISYVFMTDREGYLNEKIGPGIGRVDRHVWYKKPNN